MTTLNELTRPWEIWLVHHTHVDIGYTEPQDVILRKHAEFVALALDYCTATDALPEGVRFIWACEAAWTVKVFLARYPERSEEFFHRVREGRIEVTALYLQLTDLFTLELLEETTDYALELGRKHGFEVVTAMNDDVNGWTWGLPDLLSQRGVRYMDTAINETRSLGVRPRPAIFRWTGPQDGSVLFWHSNGYLHGNNLGLDQPDAEGRAAVFLKGLEDNGYPHNLIEVRVSGEKHDNAPPGLWLCEMVRRWNAEHQAGPKLRLVTPRLWFEEVLAHWPVPITEHRAGWPDWWADGNGSAAMESALVRTAQANLATVKALASATGQIPPADRVECAREAAAFFCEHTWGAWCSTDEPESLISKAQWNTKSGYAYTAAVEASSLVQDLLAAEARKSTESQPGILVFNPSDHTRTDVVELLAVDADIGLPGPDWILSPLRSEDGPAFYLVDEETGAVVPVLRTPAIADSARRPGQKIRFMVRDIGACGLKRYSVIPGEAPAAAGCEVSVDVLSSSSIQVVPATDGSGITAIRDRLTGVDWFETHCDYSLGEVIYETIPGPFGREKLCDWGGIQQDCSFKRTSVHFGTPEPFVLPYGAGLRFQANDLPGSLRSLVLDVVVYNDLPRVDLYYRLDKYPNTGAEALYVAFPMGHKKITKQAQSENSKPIVWLDIPGALMRPGFDQVPGTATDWHSLQHYFAVENCSGAIVVASPDIPLVQVNGINTGKWQEVLPPHNGLVMSWVMNNYWFTNFPAAQGGVLEWRYSLHRQTDGLDITHAVLFAREVRQPLVAGVIR